LARYSWASTGNNWPLSVTILDITVFHTCNRLITRLESCLEIYSEESVLPGGSDLTTSTILFAILLNTIPIFNIYLSWLLIKQCSTNSHQNITSKTSFSIPLHVLWSHINITSFTRSWDLLVSTSTLNLGFYSSLVRKLPTKTWRN
jgi:hypothetical protein